MRSRPDRRSLCSDGQGWRRSMFVRRLSEFILRRADDVFPERFVALLESLGIDSHKDAEIVYYGPSGPGTYLLWRLVPLRRQFGKVWRLCATCRWGTALKRGYAERMRREIRPSRISRSSSWSSRRGHVPWRLDESPG